MTIEGLSGRVYLIWSVLFKASSNTTCVMLIKAIDFSVARIIFCKMVMLINLSHLRDQQGGAGGGGLPVLTTLQPVGEEGSSALFL